MFNWIDKQNGVDDVTAEDINSIAHGLIDLDERFVSVLGGLKDEIVEEVLNSLPNGDEVEY